MVAAGGGFLILWFYLFASYVYYEMANAGCIPFYALYMFYRHIPIVTYKITKKFGFFLAFLKKVALDYCRDFFTFGS